MNFSINRKFSKLLSMILALVMMTTLFAGCKKDDTTEDTEPGLSINLSESSAPTETTEETAETTAPVINENTATVTSQINIRSSPSTEATITGTLYAGDKVEISRREVVTGIDWAYIIAPESGWIVMDYVEMDIPAVDDNEEDTSTPAGDASDDEEEDNSNTTTTNIKGVVNANGLNIRSEASTTTGKIQGAYNKGDVVTILETKNGWGRTNKGWIKMEYVTTATSSDNSTTTDTNKDNNTTTITSNGSTTVIYKGIVTASQLNVRASASQSADKVGSMSYGDRVQIYEKDGTWGRTKDGWISLNYVYQDGTTGSKTATGTVTATSLLVRSGPGTGYASVDAYNSGDTISILEQFTYGTTTWGCTNKGWVCMDYVNTGSSTTTNTTSTTGKVTATNLLIRSGAGTGYDVVGSLNYGDTVTILSTSVVDGVTWGKISSGWVSMTYVEVN